MTFFITPEPERSQTRLSLAAFNWNLSLRTVFTAVCSVSGFIFVNYALALGVAKEQMGYFTSLASIACLFQMLALFLTPYIRNKKSYVLNLGYIEPAVMIAAVLLALLAPAGARLPFVALAVFMTASLLHLTKPATDDWLASSIPDLIRGRYLGRRGQLQSMMMIVITIILGQLAVRMDHASGRDWALLIAVGGLFGILAVRALAGAAMPDLAATARVRLAEFGGVFRNRAFLLYVAGYLCLNFPFSIACPYYQVFYLRELNISESVVAFFLAGYYLLSVLVYPLFGRWTDRVGPRRVLAVTVPLYVVFFAGLALLTPAWHWPPAVPLAFLWAGAGVADAGFNVASVAGLYRCIPQTAGRQAYFVVFNILLAFQLAAGSFLGVPLLNWLKPGSYALGSLTLGHFNILFGLSALLMLIFLPTVRLFPESARTQSPS